MFPFWRTVLRLGSNAKSPCLRPRPQARGARSRLAGQGPAKRIISGRQPIRSWNLPPTRHAELLPQRVRVCLRRSRRDLEALSDLLVRAAGSDEGNDLALSGSDPWRRFHQCSDHERKLLGPRRGDHWPKGVFRSATPFSASGPDVPLVVRQGPARDLRADPASRTRPRSRLRPPPQTRVRSSPRDRARSRRATRPRRGRRCGGAG
jgi:hypothetical protein